MIMETKEKQMTENEQELIPSWNGKNTYWNYYVSGRTSKS